MGLLDKKATLYDRNDKGELIPREVSLEVDEADKRSEEYKDTAISITPMTRGELKELFAKTDVLKETDSDGDIILRHCKNPSYTAEDIKFLKPYLSSAIVNTILRESGLEVPKSGERKKKLLAAEDDFAKNS